MKSSCLQHMYIHFITFSFSKSFAFARYIELSSKFESAISRETQLGFPIEFSRCRYIAIAFPFSRVGERRRKVLTHIFGVATLPIRVARISLRGFLRYLGTNRRKIVPINRKTRRENHFTSQEPQDESGPTKPTRPGG